MSLLIIWVTTKTWVPPGSSVPVSAFLSVKTLRLVRWETWACWEQVAGKACRTPRFILTCTQTYHTHSSSPYFYLTSCTRSWPAGHELHLQVEKTEGSDGLSESWLSRLTPGRALVKCEPDILKWPESPAVINAVFHDVPGVQASSANRILKLKCWNKCRSIINSAFNLAQAI